MTDVKKPVAAGSVTAGETKIKMVQNHPEYIEPDMTAAQVVTDENRFAGPNPFPKDTARHAGWEYLKNLGKK